jgi:hypothetical protein
MGDFPDAYTIYTANRALCWVPHHRVPGQKVMNSTTHVLNRRTRSPRPLAHTLKFGFSDYAGSSQ